MERNNILHIQKEMYRNPINEIKKKNLFHLQQSKQYNDHYNKLIQLEILFLNWVHSSIILDKQLCDIK